MRDRDQLGLTARQRHPGALHAPFEREHYHRWSRRRKTCQALSIARTFFFGQLKSGVAQRSTAAEDTSDPHTQFDAHACIPHAGEPIY